MKGHGLYLYGGRHFDYGNPSEWRECIDVRTMAHANSQINRWGGHTCRPWTVLQHSLVLALMCDLDLEIAWALTHDGPECYTGNDFTRPLLMFVPELKTFKLRIDEGILSPMGLHVMPEKVRMLDDQMIHAEGEHFGVLPDPLCQDPPGERRTLLKMKSLIRMVERMSHEEVRTEWLRMYKAVGGGFPFTDFSQLK